MSTNTEEALKYSPDKMDEQDITILCRDCGRNFKFTTSEQKFYHEKGLEAPKRCSLCREKKKAYYNKLEVKRNSSYGSEK